MCVEVNKKLINKQNLTIKDKKLSFNTWKSKNPLLREPALYVNLAKLKQTPKSRTGISKEYK